MFDDVCMACGKQLDDGSLYCNDECMSADRDSSSRGSRARSPSRSSTSASSVFTSPYLNPNAPASVMSDIPPLMLPKKRTSSSSASSAMTSEFEEDDRMLAGMQHHAFPPFVDIKSEHVYHLPHLGDFANASEGGTPIPVSIKHHPSRRAPISALPFQLARRPAPADTRSMVPPLHPRLELKSKSQSRPAMMPMAPSGMVMATSPRTLGHRHSRSHDLKFAAAAALPPHLPKRSRASLPAYFSRLTLHAAPSPSPPTLSQIDVQVDAAADVLATPKASRRVVAPSSDKLPIEQAKSSSQKEGFISRATWESPTMPVRVPRVGSPSLERQRERGRSRVGRTDVVFGEQPQREDRVESERRGRSRVVTTRLRA